MTLLLEELGEETETTFQLRVGSVYTIKQYHIVGFKSHALNRILLRSRSRVQSVDVSIRPHRHRADLFYEPIVRLERQGRIHSALDLLYDRIDHYFREGKFSHVDSLLAHTDAASLSTVLIVGLLTATLPAKSRLPARDKLFRTAEALIKERGEWENELLTGLEP